jgi:hypothetical protein
MSGRKSFVMRLNALLMLKDFKNVREAEVNANQNKDDAGYAADPPFDLCELVKGSSNPLSAKGYEDGKKKNRQSCSEPVQGWEDKV